MEQLIIPILINGSVVALVALGYHLVIRSTGGLADFAIGQYVIISGMAVVVIGKGLQLDFTFVMLLGCLASALVAFINEGIVIRPIIRMNPDPTALAPITATFCLLWIWEQISRLIFGDFALRGQTLLPNARFAVGEFVVSAHSAFIIVTTVLVFIAVRSWLNHTKTGRMLRATGDNLSAAELLGFPVNRSRALAFIFAGATAGIAGVLACPLAGFRPLGGTYYTLNGFVALFLGGVATPLGAFVGGILLEAIKIIVGRYIGSGYQDYMVLGLALVIFRFLPQGILGKKKLRSA